MTLLVFLATVAPTGYLFVVIPKGFFPQQDSASSTPSRGGAGCLLPGHDGTRQTALTDMIARIPMSTTFGSMIGAGGPNTTMNNGRVFISLKPRDERNAHAEQIIARLRPQLAKVQGAALFMQPAQDLNIGGRLARTQFQYTLKDADFDELNQWAPKMLAKLKTLPALTDVASDQQTRRTRSP